MSLELLTASIGFLGIGYYIGKLSLGKAEKIKSASYEEKIRAYKEIFYAWGMAYSAVLYAENGADENGNISDEIKTSAFEAVTSLSRLFASTRFMFPQEVVDAIDEYSSSNFPESWSEKLEKLSRVNDCIYILARKDIGSDYMLNLPQ